MSGLMALCLGLRRDGEGGSFEPYARPCSCELGERFRSLNDKMSMPGDRRSPNGDRRERTPSQAPRTCALGEWSRGEGEVHGEAAH